MLSNSLLFKHIRLYCLSKCGVLRPKELAPRKSTTSAICFGTRKSIITAVCFSFLLAPSAQAERVGHPIKGIAVLTGTMIGCSQVERSDLSSHCYIGLVSGTWTTIFTKNPWIGTGIGCLLGAAKEAYDKQNGVAAWDDFAYTCGAAVISSYGTDNLLKFYSINGNPAVGLRRSF